MNNNRSIEVVFMNKISLFEKEKYEEYYQSFIGFSNKDIIEITNINTKSSLLLSLIISTYALGLYTKSAHLSHLYANIVNVDRMKNEDKDKLGLFVLNNNISLFRTALIYYTTLSNDKKIVDIYNNKFYLFNKFVNYLSLFVIIYIVFVNIFNISILTPVLSFLFLLAYLVFMLAYYNMNYISKCIMNSSNLKRLVFPYRLSESI